MTKLSQLKSSLIFLLCFGFAQSLKADVIQPGMLTFVYQELNEPWSAYSCEHQLSLEPYDWSVICQVGAKKKVFLVHLAVTFYNRTQFGQSAYEVLYWVTNQSTKKMQKFDSTTLWVHNHQPQSLANAFEISQGVENDFSALRLTIRLRK